VLINLLQDENGWIFLPEKIDLYYFDQKQNTYVASASQSFSSENFSKKMRAAGYNPRQIYDQ